MLGEAREEPTLERIAPELERVGAHARSLPTAWYTSPEIFELEQRHIVGRAWQYAGDAHEVAEPGSFTTATVGQVPVVITRDDDGVLHALANVCRHRGMVVATGSGRRSTLACPYHAWTYRLDGTLKSAPRFGDLDCAHFRLPELAVATWGSLLFVSLDPDVPPLVEQLGVFPDAVARTGLDVGALRRHQSIAHPMASNWKGVVDNSIECYHCQVNHPAFARDYDLRRYEYEFGGVTQCQTITGEERYAFAHLWPVSFLSVFKPTLVARAIQPLSPGHVSLTMDYYFTEDTPEAERVETVAYFEQIIAEDIPLVEGVQRGIESGTYDPGPLHPLHEASVALFHRMVFEAVGDLVGPEAAL